MITYHDNIVILHHTQTANNDRLCASAQQRVIPRSLYVYVATHLGVAVNRNTDEPEYRPTGILINRNTDQQEY